MTDCQKPVIGRGWCSAHYNRWRRTGDPLGIRRFYAPEEECAGSGCTEPVKKQRGRTAKYCSPECYRAEMRGRPRRDFLKERMCAHCGASYSPESPNQLNCLTCLGPAQVRPNGTIRYEGAARLRIYGVSHPEWLAMLARHDGKCWICRVESATDLDHSHVTGKPRGALCGGCNTNLAKAERNGWLEAARAYLEETQGTVF